jgi:hypothetical protein
LVESYLNGEGNMKSIGKAHDITHTLLMPWCPNYERSAGGRMTRGVGVTVDVVSVDDGVPLGTSARTYHSRSTFCRLNSSAKFPDRVQSRNIAYRSLLLIVIAGKIALW